MGKLVVVFGLLTAVTGWFALEGFQREGEYQRDGKVAQVRLAGSHTEQRETMKGRRGTSKAYDVEMMELTYVDAERRTVTFQRSPDSFPQDIRDAFATQRPVYVEYLPGQVRSERWQGKGGGWKVTAGLFLLFGAAFVLLFRRGLAR